MGPLKVCEYLPVLPANGIGHSFIAVVACQACCSEQEDRGEAVGVGHNRHGDDAQQDSHP